MLVQRGWRRRALRSNAYRYRREYRGHVTGGAAETYCGVVLLLPVLARR